MKDDEGGEERVEELKKRKVSGRKRINRNMKIVEWLIKQDMKKEEEKERKLSKSKYRRVRMSKKQEEEKEGGRKKDRNK